MASRNSEVKFSLDEAGDFRVLLPLSDPRTAQLQAGRTVWREYRESEGLTFAGLVESVKKTPEGDLEIGGPTLLSELLFANTLLNKGYDGQAVGAIVEDLLDVTEWVLQPEPANLESAWSCLGGGTPAWSICAVALASFSGVDQPQITGVSFAANASWLHTVPPSTNRKLVVAVSVRGGGDTNVTAVTFGGVALTQDAVSILAAQNRVEFWYLDNPAVGTGTIVVTNTTGNKTAGAISFSNAATGALTDSASAVGGNPTPAVTQGALSSSKVSISVVCAHDLNTVLTSTNREELWNVPPQGGTTGACSISPPANLLSVRYDGESRLKAILYALEAVGYHARERVTEDPVTGVLTRMLEIGAFGSSSGVTILGGQWDDLILTDPNLAYLDQISVEEISKEVWNWIVPLGAGEGSSQLTLEHNTRQPNLLLNPSFEQQFTSWVAVSGTKTIASDRAVHGELCAKMDYAGTVSETYQEVPVVAGNGYRFGAWLYKTQACTFEILVEWRNSGSGLISTSTITSPADVGSWIASTPNNSNFTAPATAVTARVRLRLSSTGTVYVDLVRARGTRSTNGIPFNVFTELTNPTALFPQLNWHIDVTGSDFAPGSIGDYGYRQRTFVAKDIAPVGEAKAALQAAANALYDLAATQLKAWCQAQTTYSLSTRGLAASVLPGHLVRVRYSGVASHAGYSDYAYVDIDEDLWVLERRRRFLENGEEQSELVVSTIDRMAQTSQDILIGKLEDTSRIFRTHIQPGITMIAAHALEEVDATHPMDFDFKLHDNVMQLLRSTVRLKPRAIRSAVAVSDSAGSQTSGGGSSHSHTFSGGTVASGGGSTSGGGAHQHAFGSIGTSETWATPSFQRDLTLDGRHGIVANDADNDDSGVLTTSNDSPGHTHSTPNHSHGFSGGTNSSDSSHTHSVAGHSHNLVFGIFESTSATGMHLWIDGVDRTTELGGPWNSTIELDVGRYLLDGDGVVVQGIHPIGVTSTQLGRVEAWMEALVLIAPFKVS